MQKTRTLFTQSSNTRIDSKLFEHSHWKVDSKKSNAREKSAKPEILRVTLLPVPRSLIQKKIFMLLRVLDHLCHAFRKRIAHLLSEMMILMTMRKREVNVHLHNLHRPLKHRAGLRLPRQWTRQALKSGAFPRKHEANYQPGVLLSRDRTA